MATGVALHGYLYNISINPLHFVAQALELSLSGPFGRGLLLRPEHGKAARSVLNFLEAEP